MRRVTRRVSCASIHAFSTFRRRHGRGARLDRLASRSSPCYLVRCYLDRDAAATLGVAGDSRRRASPEQPPGRISALPPLSSRDDSAPRPPFEPPCGTSCGAQPHPPSWPPAIPRLPAFRSTEGSSVEARLLGPPMRPPCFRGVAD